MPTKKSHPADQADRLAIASAEFFSIHLRRGPGFVIHEEPFASLAIADARALLIEAAHAPRLCMIYAVTPEGRSYLVPADMRAEARNPMTEKRAPGRHCKICGKPGGHGATTALRFLGYEIPRAEIGYAHGPCIIKARKSTERKI